MFSTWRYWKLWRYEKNLYEYIKAEDRENLKNLLLQNFSFNNCMKADYMSVHFAVINNKNTEILSLLIEFGRDINYVDDNGKTPLQYAFAHRKSKFINLLLLNGADPNIKDEDKNSLLHYAVEQSDFEMVSLILNNNADVNCTGYLDCTPLHAGIKSACSINIISLLLKHGANTELNDYEGYRPISYAVESRNVDIIELLLSYGANINYYNQFGNNPLHNAILNNFDEDIIKSYIQYGCDVSAKSIPELRTPLHCAVFRKNFRCMRLLLDNGANPNEEDVSKRTTLHYAVCLSKNLDIDVQIISLLLNYYAAANSGDEDCFTPFQHIFLNDNGNIRKNLVSLFLEHNVNLNVTDSEGLTCLMYAAYDKELDIAKLLIANGANVNYQMQDGYTVLHYAVRRKGLALVNLLLQNGANIDTYCSTTDSSPLKTAVGQGYKQIFVLLLNSGQNLSLQDRNRNLLEFTLNLIAQRRSELDDKALKTTLPEGSGCYEDFFSLLLDFGADINSVSLPRIIWKNIDLCRDIMLIHLIRIKHQNSNISSEILTFLENEMGTINSSWRREVMMLKNEILHSKYNISLYDILTKTLQEVVIYLEVKHIRETIPKYFQDKKFARYSNLLKYRFDNGVEIVVNYNECCKIVRPILREVFNKFVPEEIFTKIMSGLNEYDLNLILKENKNIML